MTRVKVCGIMDESELSMAVSEGADAVGFIVEIDDSRHSIQAGEAADLIRNVPIYTKSVAVIAPQDVTEAVQLAAKTKADVLQVHGTLRPKELAELKSMVHQKLIAAVAAGPGDAEGSAGLVSGDVMRFGMVADAILLDTMVNGKLGGSGAVHDWDHSAAVVRSMKVPVILAGGLNPGNVAEAIRKVGPYAVDVSSGLEADGRKERKLVRAFMREVRMCRL
ncbi:MAG: N-(5'-phosphoribosyl)anthranilate isomerase [Methanosaeta sp. PtaU1.Bin060]|nr:MAG: N-(5'-phosphoribosyl)anthranilate isomerase [Methanosaeta sp. PtaU1.Bin060]